MAQFSNEALMPDPVEGFAYITKNYTNFFAFVQGLTKGIVQV